MGFYFRKSISAGPFRFNLSGSGVGMSVGVKGFRIGSGPRGNYIHMGRGGIYYRASLGGRNRSSTSSSRNCFQDYAPNPVANVQQIETGNISEMAQSSSASIVEEINEKMAKLTLWPWVLGLGVVVASALGAQPEHERLSLPIYFLTVVAATLSWWWDQSRKAVVAMYDLSDEVAAAFEAFVSAFEKAGLASRIWNIDTAENTNDWKRNAGAGRLIGRKSATFTHSVPSVLKTNITVPCIRGGKQNVHFLPDHVLIAEGRRVGAISYENFDLLWNTTIFIESDSVPPDSQVVGQTWRYVNRDGGPDRRFNNNRQIPKVLYQQMGMKGPGHFQKILHLSRVEDRAYFDRALSGIGSLSRANLQQNDRTRVLLTDESAASGESDKNGWWLYLVGGASAAIALALYLFAPAMPINLLTPSAPPQEVTTPTTPAPVVEAPAPKMTANPISKYSYRGTGNAGNFESDAAGSVTEFYRHLESSDGTAAVQFVVPEKRETGPLSAAVLTAKFSDLQEPLHLDNVERAPNGTIIARYSYMPASGLKCVGLARLQTEQRGEETLISGIRYRESCDK